MASPQKTKPSKGKGHAVAATFTFDPDDFTLGELEDYEDQVGRDLFAVFTAETRSAREIRGIVWLLLRRATPDLTFDETRGVTLAQLPGILAAGSSTRSTS